MRRLLPALLACCALCLSAGRVRAEELPPAAPPRPIETWSLSLTPYLWLAGLAVDTGETTLGVPVSALTKMLKVGLMVEAEARYRRFGISADYMFIKLGTTQSLGSGSAKLDLTQHVLGLRGSVTIFDTRRIEHGPGVQLLADMGARYWKLDSALALNVPPAMAGGQGVNQALRGADSWWDWIVGARARFGVTDSVAFGLGGNLGGFNLGDSSRFTWELTGGVAFRVWKMLELDVAYRVLQYRREAADLKGDLQVQKTTMSGLLFGLGLVL